MTVNSMTVLTLSSNLTPASLKSELNITTASTFIETFEGFVSANANKSREAAYQLNIGASLATGKLVLAGEPSSGDTFTVGNKTFTAGTAAGTATFVIGTSVTQTASNIVSVVNSNSATQNMVVASSTAGTVTFTSAVPGTIGNGIELASSLTNGTAGLVAFAGGSDGTVKTFHYGL